MKKNLIALLLAAVMASGTIGTVPAMAAEASYNTILETTSETPIEESESEEPGINTDKSDIGTSEQAPKDDHDPSIINESAMESDELKDDNSDEEADTGASTYLNSQIDSEDQSDTASDSEEMYAEDQEQGEEGIEGIFEQEENDATAESTKNAVTANEAEEEIDTKTVELAALAAGVTQPEPFFIYNADILDESGTFSGASYLSMIKFEMNGNFLGNSGEVNYNLHGEYTSISFAAGFISGDSRNATLKVIGDGAILLEEEIGYSNNAKAFTLSVEGVEHLRFSYSTSGYDLKCYGIANLTFMSSEETGRHYYTSDESFDNYNDGLRKNTTTIEDSFEMGGNTYYGGYKMDMNGNWIGHTASVNFNFQKQFEEMSFDLGFISGPRSDLFYTIKVDDVVIFDNVTLPYGSIPEHIVLNLTGASVVVITVKNTDYDTNSCGIGNIRLMSDYYLTIYAYGASAFDIVFDKAAITLGSGSLGVNEGHTWLLIENNTPIGYDFNGYVIEPYQGMTIGLWPDTTIWTRGYGGVFINLENWAYRDKHVLNDISYYTIPISREDVETIESTAPDESYYHNGAHDKPKADYSDDQRHNCATFAIRMWNKVANTDDQIEEDDIDVPHNYAKKIDSKNKDKYGKKKTTTFVGNSDGLDVCHINKEGKQICFHPGGQPIEVKPSEVSLVVGESVKLEITGAIGKLSGESSNDNIATPTSAGVVNAKSVGQATIYVQAACLPNYFIEDSPERVVRVKVLPAATASITAANQKTGIKVIWKSVPGANGYYIYRNNKKIATISKGSTVTYTDKKANTNGTKYTYKIVAKAFTGTSTLSKSLVTYRLARPEITSLSNNASRKMIVKWGRNTKSSGYQIQYSLKSNFSSKKTVTISKNKTVSKTISKLTKGKKYYVRIRTYKKVGTKKYYSTWSAKKSVVIK